MLWQTTDILILEGAPRMRDSQVAAVMKASIVVRRARRLVHHVMISERLYHTPAGTCEVFAISVDDEAT